MVQQFGMCTKHVWPKGINARRGSVQHTWPCPKTNYVPEPILQDGSQHSLPRIDVYAGGRSLFGVCPKTHVARKLFLQDGSLSADSRFGCTQQDVAFFNNPCQVTYAFNEDGSAGTQRTISSVHVGAFSILCQARRFC